MTMMKVLLILGGLLTVGPALAGPLLDGDDLLNRGWRWQKLGKYEKAIEVLEQSYVERGNALCLYQMAQSYERLAAIPTKTAIEILEGKRRALDLYRQFIEEKEAEEFPHQLAEARAHIEPLRQEIEHLAPQAMTEQRLSAQKLDAILIGQKVIIDRLDTIQELLTKILRRDELRKTGSSR